MPNLFTIFNNYWDPLLHGFDHRGLLFGTDALFGEGWCIPDTSQGSESVACVGLFRVEDNAGDQTFDHPVGIALGKATSVAESAGCQDRKADTWYAYEARSINGAGVIGDPGETAVMMHTDGTGALEIIPNRPTWVSVRTLAGGKATIVVGYSPDGQAVEPIDVQVFAKEVTSPEEIDLTGLYASAETDDVTGLDYVPFVRGTYRYEFNLQAQSDGYYIFGAIFRDSGGDGNGGDVISRVVQLTTALPTASLRYALAENDY